jgi:serine/threonine protein kinase
MLGNRKLKTDNETKLNFTWLSDKFTIGKKIGSGAFGEIYEGLHLFFII